MDDGLKVDDEVDVLVSSRYARRRGKITEIDPITDLVTVEFTRGQATRTQVVARSRVVAPGAGPSLEGRQI